MLQGSGDNGRIVKRDVDSFNPAYHTSVQPGVAAAPSVPAGVENFTDTPVSQMRKVIAKRLSESKNRRFQAQVDAEREMRQSWFALEASQQSVVDLRDAVVFARETRDAYVQQFEVAQRTLLDVLDAENELFVSASELVTAETNEVLATYRILAVAGVLMTTLGVSPPEQSIAVKKTWQEGLKD